MIIQCQGCASKYFLASDKVPRKPIKVRCPKCKAVFRLQPPSAEDENLIAKAQQFGEKAAELSIKLAPVALPLLTRIRDLLRL